ncbi:MAG: hypothetical protein K2W88_12980, partial [Pararheinheimera sp.]|nr:hypothetical protein [Rheinheimera sp.]
MSTKVIKSSAGKDDVNSTVRPFSATETEADLNFGSGRYMYFTERDLSRILSNLDALRNSVFPITAADAENPNKRQQQFPSVCLIGLGRCGSNIALDVASLVYNARSFYMSEFNIEERQQKETEYRPVRWIKKGLNLDKSHQVKPVFLIEPLVMLGDLDKDIEGRIRFSHKGEKSNFLQDYNKMKIMDLSEVHAGG